MNHINSKTPCPGNSARPDPGSEMNRRYEEALAQLCLIGRMNDLVSMLDNMPSLCLSIASMVLEFTVTENCSIMLINDETGSLNLFAAKGKGDRDSFRAADKIDPSLLQAAGLAAKEGELICINDCEQEDRFPKSNKTAKQIGSLISVPIVSDDSVLGVINCSHSRKKHFREIDKQNAALVADHAAVLLQRALVTEQFHKDHSNTKRRLAENLARMKSAEEQKLQMQEQLQRSEKFVTLGEMLAGVAHELNNRVAPILIYSQMLQQSTIDEQDAKRLHIIEDSAKGAKSILETLLTYSREDKNGKETVNLNHVLESALKLIEYKIKNQGLKVRVDMSPHLPPAKVNDKQLAQVFLNIINNAIQAMEPEAGTLSIRSCSDNGKIRIIIEDSGPGVPESIAQNLFDPFFTTKDEGKGTGLGLSISKRYVEDNHGGIRYEKSALGGAAFIVEIPSADTGVGQKNGNGRANHETSGTHAKILVVDDDSTIRNVIRDILGSGYDVEFASDGRDATQKVEKTPFDLLLVDYHMPGFDGKQLYEWVAANYPMLRRRIVFSTGDIYHAETRDFIDGTGCSYLLKPFTMKSLRETVSDALIDSGRVLAG